MRIHRSAARAALYTALATLSVVTCRDIQAPVAPPPAESGGPAVTPAAPLGPASTTASVTSGPVVLVGAGDIASCSVTADEATAKLLDGIPGEVFTLGDNAYSSGTSSEYANCYGPTWGRHKERTRPAAGDKDYTTSGAPGYFGYFGAAAGDPAKGYYSYDAGDWHVIVLNSKLSMSSSSSQIAWLKSAIAASSKLCTIAYWHKPRFYSNGSSSSAKPAWEVLYKAGVELVVNADRANYERFAPQTPDGVADPAYGIRQIIAGTGGAATKSFGTPRANSEVRIAKTYGVLKLTLDAGTYAWEFVPIAGQTERDEGTGTCHGPPPPIARPGGPYRSGESVTFDGSASSDPQGDTPLTYEWDFGDPADPTPGTGAKPTHAYSADGIYTATLVVTDSKGNRSEPATATVVIENVPPAVEAGAERFVSTGVAFTYTGSFTDDELSGPWSYRIVWGDGSAEEAGVATSPGPISASHTYGAPGDYSITLIVTDAGDLTTSDNTIAHVRDPAPTVTLLAAGDIASCSSGDLEDEATAKLIDAEVLADPNTVVLTLGDNAYPNGRAQDYTNCYHPTWGRHKDRTWANLGNHEYDQGDADDAFDYYGDRAGPRGKGYYSFDAGDWHIIVLNDNSSYVPFASGSEQDTWLQADLAANTKRCTLAVWHQARFYSSTSSTTVRSSRKILWDRLWAAGAEIVLNGHQHHYERFAPMKPDGTRDDTGGIREFIVGTGGEDGVLPTVRADNSEVFARTFGILKLTLAAGWYEWAFKPIASETFTDSGSGSCH